MDKQSLNWESMLIDPTEHREILFKLYCDIFQNDTITLEQFIWKYEENPFGKMKVWSAWNVDSGQMIAAFSAYKRQFVYKSKVVDVYQQADAMVLAECRGHGVFKHLINKMTEHVRQEGALFHFGYTNNQSGPIMKKYSIVREIHLSQVFVYMNGFETAANILFKSGGFFAKLSSALGTPLIRSWNTIRGHNKIGPVLLLPLTNFNNLSESWSFEVAKFHQFFPHRSRAFMQWRAIDIPKVIKKDILNFWCLRNGKKIGYLTVYCDHNRNVLKLIDHLCTNPVENMHTCLKALRQYAIQENYDAITTNIASQFYQKKMKQAGFMKIKSVRCTIFFLKPDVLPQAELEGDFWMQFPIDRDASRY